MTQSSEQDRLAELEEIRAERLRLDAQKAEHLERATLGVADAWRAADTAAAALDWSVGAARAAGVTWAEIGDAAGGMSRQAAQKRWADQ